VLYTPSRGGCGSPCPPRDGSTETVRTHYGRDQLKKAGQEQCLLSGRSTPNTETNPLAFGREDFISLAGRPISAPAVAKPQHDGSWRALTNAPACRSDSYHMRRNLTSEDAWEVKSQVMKVLVAQADVAASAKADSLNPAPRKICLILLTRPKQQALVALLLLQIYLYPSQNG
jgi:hypothetical protein